jgi:hypothetical protein
LLHFVLHSIWAGPTQGIHSSAELLAKIDSGLSSSTSSVTSSPPVFATVCPPATSPSNRIASQV